ncbi:hypothetical protein ACJRO7_024699 [Eucalyptus globulus]|uniref:Uncharacterized protein n=1 Tax=Eucalyptus globulus TaxID=34317 RepID=A0ABD3KIU3_EUCGL
MASSLSAGKFLSTCNRTFSCGRLINISYPFTGLRTAARQSSASAATATTPSSLPDSLTYRVWALDQTRRSLALSRADLYNTSACLQQYANTTLNSSIFTLASDREGLPLFYESSKLTNINPDNQFSCEINGTETDNYYLIGAVPTDPILNGSKCEVSVTVPIQPFAAYMLTADGSRLLEVLLFIGFSGELHKFVRGSLRDVWWDWWGVWV